MKIAIVGSGVSGLVTAHLLSAEHDVVLIEADDRLGGHTNTIEVTLDTDRSYPVDTGFIVYNEKTYPNFCRLLRRLGVESKLSNMSFSVRCEATGLEYNGTSMNSLFVQRSNLFRPRFWRMVRDILRFYREAPELLEADNSVTLGSYLDQKQFSQEFVDWHLIPMGSAVWSTGREKMRDFPAHYLVKFFDNHGFLQVSERPEWRVLLGGSKSYIEPICRPFREKVRLHCPVRGIRRRPDGVDVTTPEGTESFDEVVLATHSDQALAVLNDASDAEREILGAIRYEKNETVLHMDESLLPIRKRARASWNYHLGRSVEQDRPTVTYYMNMLQGISAPEHFCVTLNATEAINPEKIIRKLSYHHPVYTRETLSAQKRRSEIDGVNRTHFCGAYWGYGFHEDGVRSALDVCQRFGVSLQ